MQINALELETARGRVIGIGRVKIPKMLVFNQEIPLLSFIVIEKADGKHISTCIHLKIDGYGNSVDEARIDMVSNILYFLRVNFKNERSKDSSWINILDLFKSDEISNNLWDRYHAFQIMLAEKGIATDNYEQLHKKIELLQGEVNKLKNEIEKMQNCESNKSISEIMPHMIIKYEEAA